MKETAHKLEREQFSPGREFALIVFNRIKPGDLIIEGEPKTSDEIIKTPEFRAAAVKVLKDFAVSGVWNREKKFLVRRTDLDGQATLGLLNLAGFDTSQIKYIKPGETALGFFNLDTGNINGLYIEGDIFEDRLNKLTSWCDNHGKESKKGSSSAEFMYQALTEIDFVEKNQILDKLIDFVNKMESGNIDWEREFWRSDKTLIGLSRFMNFKMLVDYFSSGHNYQDDIPEIFLEKWSMDEHFLSKDFLEKKKKLEESTEFQQLNPKKRNEKLKMSGVMTIKERCSEQKSIIEKTKEQLIELEKEGFVIKTDYGKVVIVPGEKKFLGGFSGAYASGANGFLVWNPKTESFVFSIKEGDLKLTLDQGVLVRNHIWIKPDYDNERVRLSLEEILKSLGFNDVPSTKLKEVFNQDLKEKRGVFTVTATKTPQGYITYVDNVFSLFPRDFNPGSKKIFKVRIAEIKKDRTNRDFYILKVEKSEEKADKT